MPELRSFKHDEDVAPGTYVWFHFAGMTDTTAKLGQVLGTVGCFLVVQTGPERFEHVMVAPKWHFYEYERPDIPGEAWYFTGSVQDTGGGLVTVLVDRETESYPMLGNRVRVEVTPDVR